MDADDVIEQLQRECSYSDEGGFDDAGNDLGSVDALIEYKNALEDKFRDALNEGRMAFARELEAMLWPERFPPGHERHNPDHVYWQGQSEFEPAFQWSADTIEWVADAIVRELGEKPEVR